VQNPGNFENTKDSASLTICFSGHFFVVAYEGVGFVSPYNEGTYNRPYKVAVHGETRPYKYIHTYITM
jgi:hypothetical protein